MAEYQPVGDKYGITLSDGIHKVGKGSFADVYKCHKIGSDKKLLPEEYILKMIFPNPQIPHLESLIQKEVETMTILSAQCPNVVRIYESFRNAQGQHCLVMEYCSGGDLENYVNSKPVMSESEVASFLRPVVIALDYMHSHKLIHRDLKLANILLLKPPQKDVPPEIRITDFGLAFNQEERGDGPDTICGTPVYMAPEIAGRGEYTNSVDIWSFGIMFYKMIYGYFPFGNAIKEDVTKGILRIPRARMVSRACLDVLANCLRLSPRQRISFAQLKTHPFFTRTPEDLDLFDTFIDGTLGYREIDMRKNIGFLASSPEVHELVEDLDDILNEHNEEVLHQT